MSFSQRGDLLFCWVESGDCVLLRPDANPLRLMEHDFVFIRTSTPFTLASDPGAASVGSDEIITATGLARMDLGDNGAGKATVLRGGRFVFDAANEALLIGMLPQVMKLNAGDPQSSGHLQGLLMMNEVEGTSQNPGSQFFVERLMELILLEALRRVVTDMDASLTGLLAGLADTKVALVLTAIHERPSQAWSVSSLASLCGLSRSGLAHRFSSVMGIGVIEYLQQWRMSIAKDALRSSALAISEIAFQAGFQSSSAFSTAFSRIVGCSPKQFRDGENSQR